MERIYEWNKIKNLDELSWLPDRYDIEDKMLFRSPLLLINHLMWNQLSDYLFYNQINSGGDSQITVHAYYTLSIHHLHKLKTVEIPANVPFNDTITVRNYSRLREESLHPVRLEDCLVPEKSEPLKKYLEHLHRVQDIAQYCSPENEIIEIKGDGSVAQYDRVWVAWAIDLVLGLYREDMEGNVNLIGCSDYLVDFATQIYPKSNLYWIDRIQNETIMARSHYGSLKEEQFNSVYIPGQSPIRTAQEKDKERESENSYIDSEWVNLNHSENEDQE